jgi:cytochrome b561
MYRRLHIYSLHLSSVLHASDHARVCMHYTTDQGDRDGAVATRVGGIQEVVSLQPHVALGHEVMPHLLQRMLRLHLRSSQPPPRHSQHASHLNPTRTYATHLYLSLSCQANPQIGKACVSIQILFILATLRIPSPTLPQIRSIQPPLCVHVRARKCLCNSNTE